MRHVRRKNYTEKVEKFERSLFQEQRKTRVVRFQFPVESGEKVSPLGIRWKFVIPVCVEGELGNHAVHSEWRWRGVRGGGS